MMELLQTGIVPDEFVPFRVITGFFGVALGAR